ncbi:MAG TPA: 50S ribosomal protein L19 [Candidatus Paceibacterota bacterium]|nr:50S ribosomal protein L19 [Candidatus Paceibacterota bacterium]
MENITSNIAISPVDMGSRSKLGLKAGDTVRVTSKIQEKGKTRLQAFEGLVIAVKHGREAGGTFTVRKVTSGVGVEKIFTLYSPLIDKIQIVRRSKTRRAKLYYIREKTAREIRRKMKGSSDLLVSTEDLRTLEAEETDKEASETAEITEEATEAEAPQAETAEEKK